jgi:uncharacterized glyoxalase superfamily protein PhnB
LRENENIAEIRKELSMADTAPATEVRSVLTPTAFYRDPKAALQWLENAFGFEVRLLLTDADGNLAHAEMGYRGARIGVAGEWEIGGAGSEARAVSPRTTGGGLTQFVWVEVEGDIDAHHERARAAGARILQPPQDQFYGARTYRAVDPEGHVWNFRQEVREVSLEEMEAQTGLKHQKTGRS